MQKTGSSSTAVVLYLKLSCPGLCTGCRFIEKIIGRLIDNERNSQVIGTACSAVSHVWRSGPDISPPIHVRTWKARGREQQRPPGSRTDQINTTERTRPERLQRKQLLVGTASCQLTCWSPEQSWTSLPSPARSGVDCVGFKDRTAWTSGAAWT